MKQNSARVWFFIPLLWLLLARPTHAAESNVRWRILYLRGQIDSELFRRHDKMEGPVLKAAFEELTRLYHAEHVHGMPVRPPQISLDKP